MSKSDIARAENINEKAIRESIERGLKNMEKLLKKTNLPSEFSFQIT